MYFEISNPMYYKVALYIRLSKEDGSEKESQSVTNQRSLLREFVKSHKLDVFDEYIDDGISGTTFDRPGFDRLLADIEAKKVNMVITKDMSRLGRDYIMTGFYMEKFFPEQHVRYISLLDGVDTGVDSTSNDISPFKAIMNDMYAKDISNKIKSVKRNKQDKGLFIGGKASYGYKLSETEKNKIDIDEEVAPTVKRIFEMAVNGESARQIAIKLNNEGIPTPAQYSNLSCGRIGPYSGLWSSERIAFMLKNQLYVGNMVQGRSKKLSYKSKKELKLPPEEWKIVADTHEAIIDKATFDKVQDLLKSRNRVRSRTIEYPLKGLIYCHECGYPLACIKRHISSGEVIYLICRTYQRFTKLGKCTSHSIREDVIHNAVMSKITILCADYINTQDCKEIHNKVINELAEQNNVNKTITDLQSKIDNLTTKLDAVYLDKINGVLERADFDRIYEQIKKERLYLEEQIKSLEVSTPQENQLKRSEINSLIRKFLKTANCNRELLVSLIERVELTKDREIMIFFKFKELENALK